MAAGWLWAEHVGDAARGSRSLQATSEIGFCRRPTVEGIELLQLGLVYAMGLSFGDLTFSCKESSMRFKKDLTLLILC